ncbi:pyruvate dehydrogenase (acetyl-transferring) kinase, mitochondrial-like [Xenia sp. Carnegie-2017]|uniref:pyruvate dehydrogenase (acetyl-transferring) kinase, mitochondrial-like n=1 Tax=Xenia sp. Carnegie-2017 TaxID=2897299 RepID=UPI001F048EFA|nr:pyruvate dehydrogenase (acetyl-transferring) kinase, mitochondrial-like [Xenia sp. Carnegie-2017]
MRWTKILNAELLGVINRYSGYQQYPLTIEQFTSFGKHGSQVESFQFCRHQMPVRLAHIIREINHLPINLLKTPSVELVQSWYHQSFEDLICFAENHGQNDAEMADKFDIALKKIRSRHDTVVETMAQGIIELKERDGEDALHPSIQYFLDRFYMNRIGIRTLITQHLLISGEEAGKSKTNWIGCFNEDCSIKSVVTDAAINARFICEQVYLCCPEVIVDEHNVYGDDGDGPIRTTYVPSHLYHMIFELLKNSMRAVVEHSPEDQLPDVKVLITKGKEDLTIKISDLGGGIPKNQIEKLFLYHYTTAPQPVSLGDGPALAGYGYGLPLSRLYAKYFGGDLQLFSMEGYGTDALVYIKAALGKATEVLPLYNKRTSQTYSEVNHSVNQMKDWSSSSYYEGLGHGYLRGSTYKVRHFGTLSNGFLSNRFI